MPAAMAASDEPVRRAATRATAEAARGASTSSAPAVETVARATTAFGGHGRERHRHGVGRDPLDPGERADPVDEHGRHEPEGVAGGARG